jgi:tetratricopeptide (TPR) repeat protein/GTPase SAR1 family protein
MARNVVVGDDIWRASVLLPLRQTQTFEGRGEEIGLLKDWWADVDSRACLVYGEGGIGKTTLVLQFLNDLLDDPPTNLEWRPELIFYYSAKLTRWGVSGLEQIGGISANVNEAIRSLVRVLEPRLSREWHGEESKSLISKAAALFQAAGLKRDSILLVIDNTETLARTAAEEAGLAKVLRELSTKLAKLLITSRRSEKFESTHIPVPPMSEDVGAILLAKLADTYSSKSILDAGEPRRRKLTRQFGGKPILLDVLARHIANTSCSIDDGVTAILNQERGDLGAFLFEDAWKRMEASYRDVFLALGQLGGSVGEQMLNWACAEFTCYAPSWLSAYEETRFGSLIDYGPNYDITLDAGAREFISSKFERLTGPEKQRITTAVGHIRKKHHQAASAMEERVSDRVAAAFRTTAAKAAKLAGMRRDFETAVRWYDEATLVDSANAALFDRYAWYLMVNDRLDRASSIARKATALDPDDADSHFTAGMIAARQGEISEADSALEIARRLGKADQLVDLQRARARLEHAVKTHLSDPEDCLEKSLDAIRLLESAVSDSTPANYKHEAERLKLSKRVNRLIESVRTVRTFTPVRS